MSIKKRLFYSNLLMVVMPLIAFAVTSLVFGGILRSTLFADFDEMSVMNEPLLEIQAIIDDLDMDSFAADTEAQNDLMDSVAALGFRLRATQNDKILCNNINGREQNGMVLWNSAKTSTTPIIFIVGGGGNPLGKGFAGTIVTTLLLTIAAVFVIIILFSLFLANRMVKKIAVPLNRLCDGAQRVREGNLDEDIHCRDAAELEKVCESFNEMQHQLRENINKNNVYEQDRKEMLAGISHDLRTPLTSIKSYVKGLQDGVAQTPEKQRDYLDIVYRKSADMERLLDRLFLFSKLETGNMPFNFRSVSIQKYLVTLLDSLEYDIIFDGDCAYNARLDTEQMTRAIANILDNSVKYNPEKHIQITVTLREQDGKINIRLQDNGVGVSNAQLPRLFDSFYRGDESRVNSSDGSGLGLAIAKNIVIAHGGSIYAESYNGLAIIIDLPTEMEGAR